MEDTSTDLHIYPTLMYVRSHVPSQNASWCSAPHSIRTQYCGYIDVSIMHFYLKSSIMNKQRWDAFDLVSSSLNPNFTIIGIVVSKFPPVQWNFMLNTASFPASPSRLNKPCIAWKLGEDLQEKSGLPADGWVYSAQVYLGLMSALDP